MLIEFSVENYLSFKELVTFSMSASTHKQHLDTHVFEEMDYKLLKSSAIYGANASGKSNLYKAMNFAKKFILKSSKETQMKDKISVQPFLLNSETEKEPSLFEFVFIHHDIKYRYGFRANEDKILDEWLFSTKKAREIKLFERANQDIKVTTNFKEGKDLEGKTRENALFLSVVAQFNGKTAELILDWFYSFSLINGTYGFSTISSENLNDQQFKAQVTEILNIADLAIDEFRIEKKKQDVPKFIQELIKETLKNEDIAVEEDEDLTSYQSTEIKTIHKKYNNLNVCVGMVEFDLRKQESDGTRKLFSIFGPILETLNKGSVLFVDELEVNLHPLITRFIVELFNSKAHNNKKAQLIFSTHDTNLLNKELLRRDQIWFTEKDKYGATDLYSLAEYKDQKGSVRQDRTFAKDYLAGRYGAIPFIGEFDFDDEEGC